MSPLFDELIRLVRRYDAACRSPLSCPRDREILRTRIADLEEVVKTIRASFVQVTDLSEADRARLRNNLAEMRKSRTELKTARNSADTVIADKATVQDAETLLVYTRFLIGLIEQRNDTKKGENSDDPDPDHSCI